MWLFLKKTIAHSNNTYGHSEYTMSNDKILINEICKINEKYLTLIYFYI